MSPLGAPVSRSSPVGKELRVFDHIPRLREVLAHGGWPGATYAQVLIENLKSAYERNERPTRLDHLEGGKIYYTIVGPKGRVDVALVGSGEIIPGASPESGNRLFFTDGEIGEETGLTVQYPIWFKEEPRAYRPPEVEVAQDPDRDARVQAREPAQRVKKGTRGKKSKAGGSHRSLGISQEERLRRSDRMKAMWAARRQPHA